jgi:uncharacterized cupredoxin-like copper-binding protein
MSTKLHMVVLAALLGTLAQPAFSHGDAMHDKKASVATSIEEKPFGREGDPKRFARTINVDMSDQMRFTPAEVTVKQGETIRFRVKNSGKVMHELVLGTMKDLKAHADMMKKHPGMEHDEPYMAHVAPGKTETIVWQFTKPGEFHYGCLVPGHFEAGMLGKVNVTPPAASSNKH